MDAANWCYFIKTWADFLHFAQKYFLTGTKNRTFFKNQFLRIWKW